jgi:hypothetical protein
VIISVQVPKPLFSTPLVYPWSGIDGHTVTLCLTFWGIAKLFPSAGCIIIHSHEPHERVGGAQNAPTSLLLTRPCHYSSLGLLWLFFFLASPLFCCWPGWMSQSVCLWGTSTLSVAVCSRCSKTVAFSVKGSWHSACAHFAFSRNSLPYRLFILLVTVFLIAAVSLRWKIYSVLLTQRRGSSQVRYYFTNYLTNLVLFIP